MAKLVIGCGESTVQAIREADNDTENWTLARVLWPDVAAEHEAGMGTDEWWCVLLEDDAVEASDLDQDRAVIHYRTVSDFTAALGACQGVRWQDPAQRDEAISAMDAAMVLG